RRCRRPSRPSQADAALISQQVPCSSNAPAPQMIYVIERAFTAAQIDQVFDRSDKIPVSQNSLVQINVDAKLLVQLITPHPSEVIFLRIEKQSFQKCAGVRHRWRIARAQTAVNILERFFLI